jgi:hypothetical protein
MMQNPHPSPQIPEVPFRALPWRPQLGLPFLGDNSTAASAVAGNMFGELRFTPLDAAWLTRLIANLTDPTGLQVRGQCGNHTGCLWGTWQAAGDPIVLIA